ncbi:MAG: hypothetical protein V1809_07010 [Planctomycetota bacterium]
MIPVDILVFAALRRELRGFLRRKSANLRRVDARTWMGIFGPHQAVFCITGVGAEAARFASEKIMARFKASFVVSVGFAGGLAPGLATGTLVVARETGVIGADGFRPSGNGRITDEVRKILARGFSAVHEGRLVSVSAPVFTPANKASLRESAGADAVDMESAALAGLMKECGIPFAAVRAVLDETGDDLSRLGAAWRRYGPFPARRMGLLRAVLADPGLVPVLWGLRKKERIAAEILGRFIEDLVT